MILPEEMIAERWGGGDRECRRTDGDIGGRKPGETAQREPREAKREIESKFQERRGENSQVKGRGQ